MPGRLGIHRGISGTEPPVDGHVIAVAESIDPTPPRRTVLFRFHLQSLSCLPGKGSGKARAPRSYVTRLAFASSANTALVGRESGAGLTPSARHLVRVALAISPSGTRGGTKGCKRTANSPSLPLRTATGEVRPRRRDRHEGVEHRREGKRQRMSGPNPMMTNVGKERPGLESPGRQ